MSFSVTHNIRTNKNKGMAKRLKLKKNKFRIFLVGNTLEKDSVSLLKLKIEFLKIGKKQGFLIEA